MMKLRGLLIVCCIWVPLAYADSAWEGGSCEYRQYKGQAKIISINPVRATHNYFHEVYEVKFSFSSEQEIQEKFAQTEGKEFVLLLDNSSYPGQMYLEKYEIKTGETFDCYMKVIIRGVCSPVRFEFPTIRLDDYFEDQG